MSKNIFYREFFKKHILIKIYVNFINKGKLKKILIEEIALKKLEINLTAVVLYDDLNNIPF